MKRRCDRLSQRRAGRAGYTVVEVLMSMAVLAVGVMGVIASQKVMVASNAHAKNLAIATHIGQSWMGMLEAESALWGADNSLVRTTWLSQGAGQGTWFRPNYDPVRLFGPAFDALGNPVATEDEGTDARYCVDLRMSPLHVADGGGLMRVEVRVAWLRDEIIGGGTVTAPAQPCGVTAAVLTTAAAQQLYHIVFFSGAVRQVVSS